MRYVCLNPLEIKYIQLFMEGDHRRLHASHFALQDC
jgi:hypothetical protein